MKLILIRSPQLLFYMMKSKMKIKTWRRIQLQLHTITMSSRRIQYYLMAFLVLCAHLDWSNYPGPWDRSWSIGSFWKPGTASFLGVPRNTTIFVYSRILPLLLGEVYWVRVPLLLALPTTEILLLLGPTLLPRKLLPSTMPYNPLGIP